MEGAEEGSLLVRSLCQTGTAAFGSDLAFESDLHDEETVCLAQNSSLVTLDNLTSHIQSKQPTIFSGCRGEAAQQQLLEKQLQAIIQVLFKELRFKVDQVEWVYDGLAPALLPDLLAKRQAVSLSLSVCVSALSRRLGVSALVVPVRVSSATGATAAPGNAALSQLPAQHVTRHLSRPSLAGAPPSDTWAAVAYPYTTSTSPAAPRPVMLDLRRAELREAPPGVPQDQAGLLDHHLVSCWAAYCRLIMTVHQRRGESDEVAHWLLQVLALDPQAPEWDYVINTANTARTET